MVQTISAITAGIALAVSIIVFMDNRRRAIELSRLARRPALVFTWDGDMKRWTLSNIGSGPALDVIVIQRHGGVWQHPLRFPEMAIGQSALVPRRWSEKHDDPGLGVRYRSITGEQYMTRTGDDWSQMSEGLGDWSAGLWRETEPYWHYRDRV